MKHTRELLTVAATFTVAFTAISAWVLDPAWTVVVACIGGLSTILLATFIVLRSVQTALQRLTGIIRQQDRILEHQNKLERDLKASISGHGVGDNARLSSEARSAIEEIRLASRSITVPQAHFDQLLRTISANTVRTEAALDDAVEAMRSERQPRSSEYRHSAEPDARLSSEPISADDLSQGF